MIVLAGSDRHIERKLAEDDASFEGSPSRGRHGIWQLGLNQFSRRYIYHLLARLTSYTEVGSGKPDLFDKYIDRSVRNPYDIEHIWPDDFDHYTAEFPTRQEFDEWRNHVAGLLLLPADVNRSYKDKPFEEKAPHYAKQNLYAASLTSWPMNTSHSSNPSLRLRDLPFRPYEHFGKHQQEERSELVLELCSKIWSAERLEEYRP